MYPSTRAWLRQTPMAATVQQNFQVRYKEHGKGRDNRAAEYEWNSPAYQTCPCFILDKPTIAGCTKKPARKELPARTNSGDVWIPAPMAGIRLVILHFVKRITNLYTKRKPKNLSWRFGPVKTLVLALFLQKKSWRLIRLAIVLRC